MAFLQDLTKQRAGTGRLTKPVLDRTILALENGEDPHEVLKTFFHLLHAPNRQKYIDAAERILENTGEVGGSEPRDLIRFHTSVKNMNENMNELMWWGYLHQNGTIQVKRWFGDHADYTDDCYGNPFVLQIVTPFAASSREEATEIIEQQIRTKD